MSITEPAKITTPWASTGSKNPIPANANNTTGAAGFDKGFPDITMTPEEAGGLPPAGQDFNGIFYQITNIIRYMQSGGRAHFSSDLSNAIGGYPIGSLILGDDGLSIFSNTISGNTSNPNTGGAGWARPDLQVMELYRRSYAEAGYNLVAGSFEIGGTLVNTNDVLLQERTGKAFSGPAGTVSAGTNPASGGFVDRSNDLVRGAFSYADIRSYAGSAKKIYCFGKENIFDGGNGYFVLDEADTTSLDNGGTVFVDGLGRRWKRVFTGPVQLSWFVVNSAGVDSFGVQNATAINAALSTGKSVELEHCAEYVVTPYISDTDEAGFTTLAIRLRSQMHMFCSGKCTIRISDNFSTDANPKRHAMFFSNDFLSDITFDGIIMDMNGHNNKISPNRASLSFNRFTNPQICFSGTKAGVAAGANNVTVKNCAFRRNAGVSCIVMAQSNLPGVSLGKTWRLLDNEFFDVGIDTDDHSSVFGWAVDVLVDGNTFRNPMPYNATTKTGGFVAYEIHGSDTRFVNNTIANYAQGLWASINLTEEIVSRLVVSNNTAMVSATFIDFYSANLGLGPSPESAIHEVSIDGNTITITNDGVPEDLKAFFKVGARRMPSRVKIANNICRSLSTTKTTVLCLIPVVPEQLAEADQISITGNEAAGITSGLVCYFGGTTSQNIGRVKFINNDLGFLVPSPDGAISSADVLLYGANDGKVSSLKVSGVDSIITDGRPSGRATIKGVTKVSLPVIWSGVSIGNGSFHNQVSINSDEGFATVEVGFYAGSTTAISGNILPTITGLVADGMASARASHVKSGAAVEVPGLVFSGSSSISLYNSDGTLLDSSNMDSTTILIASAKIPCRHVSV